MWLRSKIIVPFDNPHTLERDERHVDFDEICYQKLKKDLRYLLLSDSLSFVYSTGSTPVYIVYVKFPLVKRGKKKKNLSMFLGVCFYTKLYQRDNLGKVVVLSVLHT